MGWLSAENARLGSLTFQWNVTKFLQYRAWLSCIIKKNRWRGEENDRVKKINTYFNTHV